MKLNNRCWLLPVALMSMLLGSGCEKPGAYVPGELVVSFKQGVSQEQVALLAKEVDAEVGNQVEGTNIYLFSFASDSKATAAIDILKQKASVESVFRNIKFTVPEPE